MDTFNWLGLGLVLVFPCYFYFLGYWAGKDKGFIEGKKYEHDNNYPRAEL